jgi:hypothetical protein
LGVFSRICREATEATDRERKDRGVRGQIQAFFSVDPDDNVMLKRIWLLIKFVGIVAVVISSVIYLFSPFLFFIIAIPVISESKINRVQHISSTFIEGDMLLLVFIWRPKVGLFISADF